jgi:tRNA(Ile)-lysidine synthase
MRNRMRLEVLPLATARLNPRAPEALARLGAESGEIESWLREQATAALADAGAKPSPGHNQVETAGLRPYHAIVRRYALRMVYECVRGERADLTRDHLLAMDRLLFGPGEVHLPGGIRAIGEHGRLRFGALSEPVPRALGDERPVPVPVGDTLSLPGVALRLRTEELERGSLEGLPNNDRAEVVFDLGRLEPPLEIRAWAAGDRFTPLGMDGSQKVSDLFINLGVPRSNRLRVPILVDGRGILWVVGHRRSDRAPVTPATERVLRVVAEPGEIRIG